MLSQKNEGQKIYECPTNSLVQPSSSSLSWNVSENRYTNGCNADRIIPGVLNQSRLCGKGVCLGLFPSDSLESPSYEFIEIAHIAPYYGVENDCRNFSSNRIDSVRYYSWAYLRLFFFLYNFFQLSFSLEQVELSFQLHAISLLILAMGSLDVLAVFLDCRVLISFFRPEKN